MKRNETRLTQELLPEAVRAEGPVVILITISEELGICMRIPKAQGTHVSDPGQSGSLHVISLKLGFAKSTASCRRKLSASGGRASLNRF